MTKTIEVTLPELLEGLNAGRIPKNAKVQVTFDEDAFSSAETSHDPTVALFERWAQEDAAITPEQEAENERIYAEIERNGIPRVRI